jgi:hypothetical protein
VFVESFFQFMQRMLQLVVVVFMAVVLFLIHQIEYQPNDKCHDAPKNHKASYLGQ